MFLYPPLMPPPPMGERRYAGSPRRGGRWKYFVFPWVWFVNSWNCFYRVCFLLSCRAGCYSGRGARRGFTSSLRSSAEATHSPHGPAPRTAKADFLIFVFSENIGRCRAIPLSRCASSPSGLFDLCSLPRAKRGCDKTHTLNNTNSNIRLSHCILQIIEKIPRFAPGGKSGLF